MIPMQHTEEVLSVAYVKSIVSHFGHTYSTIDSDYGTDGCVRNIKQTEENKFIDLGTKFDCQIKATTDWELKNETIVYDMKVDAYNRLILRNNEAYIPCLLILLCLPKEKDRWVSVVPTSFQIRNCCYYAYLFGDLTTNSDWKRIFIPTKNIFNSENLEVLFSNFYRAVNYE